MYRREIRIEFNHCDPAGIVFFPRYFEMLNSQVENFFRDVLDYPFEKMMFGDGHAVPTVHFEIAFAIPRNWASWCGSNWRSAGWGAPRSI